MQFILAMLVILYPLMSTAQPTEANSKTMRTKLEETKAKIENAEKLMVRRYRANDLKTIVTGIDNYVQQYCTDKKRPPTKELINKHVADMKIELTPELEGQPAGVTVDNVNVNHSPADFECKGSLQVTVSKLSVKKRTFNLPVPHESDLKEDFWLQSF